MSVPESKKKKKFINLPSYPGGSSAFKKFVSENLKYPDEALKNNIKGYVYLEYNVDSGGKISQEKITKSLGFGCDEEALRVVRLLKYNPPKNRGVKVSSKMKTRFYFSPPKQNNEIKTTTFNYTSSSSKTEDKKNESQKVYNYTIKF